MAPTYAAAEAELLRLETAVAAISTNLVDLDDNPARKELDRTRLTGRTAAAWADASDALTRLWDGYRLLTDLITRARSISGQRRISDAERAGFVHEVLGESITLSTEVVPLAQRGLLGPGHVTTVCTPAELLSAMERAFTTAVAVATRAGEVWDKMLPAAADAAAALENVRRLGGDAVTLAEADRRLGAFTATLAGDPLSVDEKDLQAVRVLIDRADAERTSAAELRSALEQRLADARRLLADLASAAGAAAKAEEAAADRFLPRDLFVVGGGDLRPDLAAIEALAGAGHWSLISPRLADWTRRARERLAALRDATTHNAGLLAARNELRGRLDAYHAKALSRGLGEQPALVLLHDAARTALYTAPCDLTTARAAVNAYQDALTATIARNSR
ncbi:hypothetical protein AB0J83_23650 [Actinoplanes sp. NPDC049596]|uniref:hypothetical protein n=1 Tax=unclassified Actinoplanes TaxID=2626549 RepID=UPI0034479495